MCLPQNKIGTSSACTLNIESCHVTHTSPSQVRAFVLRGNNNWIGSPGRSGGNWQGMRAGPGVTLYSPASIMNACLAIIKCSGILTSRKAGHTHTHTDTQSPEQGCCAATRKWLLLLLLLPQVVAIVVAGNAIKHFAVQCCSCATDTGTGTAIILQCNMCDPATKPNLTLATPLNHSTGLPACLLAVCLVMLKKS